MNSWQSEKVKYIWKCEKKYFQRDRVTLAWTVRKCKVTFINLEIYKDFTGAICISHVTSVITDNMTSSVLVFLVTLTLLN